ncbi:MAG: trimethylamine methyltransferase family protein [Clostridiales bacterium]|nr:trimethylamine methyltransferase family protein [Clostridiales bacterium]
MTVYDRLQQLNMEQMQTIHDKTVNILEKNGMRFSSEKARDIFRHHGFKVEGEIVYITDNDINNALKTVPSTFQVKAPNPERSVLIGEDNYVLGPSGGATNILDYCGTVRNSTSEDCKKSIKIAHSLPNVDFNRAFVLAGDVPEENVPLYHLLLDIKFSDKPLDCISVEGTGLLSILFGLSMSEIKENTQKGIAYAISYINPISPLMLSENESDRLIGLCQKGVALGISPMPLAGTTGPCTLPGLLITQNCEILGTVVLSQLINPGCPVLYGCIGTITDMKDVTGPIGAPEARLIENASAQLGRFYGMPSRGNAALTDANSVDFQAGAEALLNFSSAIRSGINLLPGLGTMGALKIVSLEKLVLDAELASYVNRMVQPLNFTEDNMAVDVIERVGTKGSFITEMHTSQHFRDEFYLPKLFNRKLYETWVEKGEKDALTMAHEKVNEILESYTAPDLDKSIEKDLDKYVEAHYPVQMG